ncbi:uncharacterized protein LOC122332312 [Puntigrus tetrazona]|uniref:uncharacterized protein LOC122332312 n=1 Tax=Puntigrus tetrazona TaxID=1606681 RepID=UPI001C89703F|nr:uncharacterized protein LOC122332312 [Puntigrus tetrazona]
MQEILKILFKSALDKSLNYSGFEGVVIIVLFVLVLLFNLFFIIFLFLRFFGKVSLRIRTIFNVLAEITFDVLPSLQFILLFFSFGSRGGFLIVAVLPVFLTVSRYDWDFTCGQQMGCSPAVRRSVYLTLMILINALLIYFYITALENQNDVVGWSCMLVFLQFLWTLINFTWSFPSSFDLPRVTVVYVFGSVGVVLLNSVALMTEVILKTVNGEGLTGDMRISVFSTEFIFTLILLVLVVFEPWIKPCLDSCQKSMKSCRSRGAGSQSQESEQNPAAGCDEAPAAGSDQKQITAESHEMNPLLNEQTQENHRSDAAEETEPNSVITQT